jgi:hypothetical protein
MTSTYSKILTISEDTQLSESQVAKVLYSYLCWCLEEVLIDKKSNTIFGELKLNSDNKLELQHNINGLISLIGKSDIKLIRKICEEGPDFKIFG